MGKKKATPAPAEPETVASEKDNAKLEHSVDGATTRDDAADLGVTMLQGDASEPVGPEDAFGEGDKRGDYRGRQDGGTHVQMVPTADGGEPITDDDGNILDYKPNARPVDQVARTEQIGEVEGKKGGVETADAT